MFVSPSSSTSRRFADALWLYLIENDVIAWKEVRNMVVQSYIEAEGGDLTRRRAAGDEGVEVVIGTTSASVAQTVHEYASNNTFCVPVDRQNIEICNDGSQTTLRVENSSGGHTGAIVGGSVVGVVLAVALIAVVAVVVSRRNSNKAINKSLDRSMRSSMSSSTFKKSASYSPSEATYASLSKPALLAALDATDSSSRQRFDMDDDKLAPGYTAADARSSETGYDIADHTDDFYDIADQTSETLYDNDGQHSDTTVDGDVPMYDHADEHDAYDFADEVTDTGSNDDDDDDDFSEIVAQTLLGAGDHDHSDRNLRHRTPTPMLDV